MGYSIESSLIIVNHYAAAVEARTDAIVENQRHTVVDKPLKVVVLLRILSLGNDDAAHLMLVKALAKKHFTVILFVALAYHYRITARGCLLFNAAQNRRKIEVCKLRDNDSNDF